MSDPTSTNILLSLPVRGTDAGTWDVPVNGNSSALDGYLGGVQTIGVSSSPVTLTAPAGIPTPGGGPTQAQNAVLRVTGALTSNVPITLPLPGYYIVENLTTGAFVLSFRALSAGEIVGLPQGESQHIYSDGTNVRFVNFGRIGHSEIWAGYSAMPAWVTACTKKPYLLNDGTIYNVSDYPYLGTQLLGKFGGNGITTFAVPDDRGRLQLPYDGTGTRITAAGCGINGQTIGASLDQQTVSLTIPQIPTHNHTAVVDEHGGHLHVTAVGGAGTSTPGAFPPSPGTSRAGSGNTDLALTGISVNIINTGGGGAHNNVQPAIVTGISVIRAA